MDEQSTEEKKALASVIAKIKARRQCSYFDYYWDSYLSDILTRNSFRPSALFQLADMCDLYVERDRVVAAIDEDGLTFTSFTKQGNEIVKAHPLLAHKNSLNSAICRLQIALDIKVYKEVIVPEEVIPLEEMNEWATGDVLTFPKG